VNAKTGKELWRFKTGKYGNCFSPVVHNGIVYHGSRDGILYALSLEGEELWRFKAGGLIAVGVLINDNRIYFGSEDANVYCLDLKTGKELWRFKTSGQVWSPPALWKDSVFFGSWDCRFYCISLEGKELWRFVASDTTICKVDPPYKIFEMVVKKSFDEADGTGEKYDLDFSGRGSDDVYSVKSEYVFETTYATRKDYGE
jgi:outer membrane protein assembly factor BamB